MRARLLAAIMTLATVVIVAVLVPSLQAISTARTHELEISRAESVARFAALAQEAVPAGDATALRRHAERVEDVFGEAVLVTDASGRALVATGDLSREDPRVASVLRDAGRNQPRMELAPLRPWSPQRHVVGGPVASTGDLTTGAVVLEVDAARAVADIRRSWLLVGALAVVLLGGLAVLAQSFSRWVLRPVHSLDLAVRAVAEGVEPVLDARSGPPELQSLVGSVQTMSTSVRRTLDERERLIHDFSHRLRNPLAAMRLRVDTLNAQGVDGLAPVDEALSRVESTVSVLLQHADAEHRAGEYLAGPGVRGAGPGPRATLVLDDVRTRWAGPAEARGGRLVTTGPPVVELAAAAADLTDVVDELVENALRYGTGTVTVSVDEGSDLVSVSVRDEGPVPSDEDLEHARERFWRGSASERFVDGTGMGLSIVDQLVRAHGGTLEVGRVEPHGWRTTVTLPRAS